MAAWVWEAQIQNGTAMSGQLTAFPALPAPVSCPKQQAEIGSSSTSHASASSPPWLLRCSQQRSWEGRSILLCSADVALWKMEPRGPKGIYLCVCAFNQQFFVERLLYDGHRRVETGGRGQTGRGRRGHSCDVNGLVCWGEHGAPDMLPGRRRTLPRGRGASVQT